MKEMMTSMDGNTFNKMTLPISCFQCSGRAQLRPGKMISEAVSPDLIISRHPFTHCEKMKDKKPGVDTGKDIKEQINETMQHCSGLQVKLNRHWHCSWIALPGCQMHRHLKVFSAGQDLSIDKSCSVGHSDSLTWKLHCDFGCDCVDSHDVCVCVCVCV